jgi:hypothetical protein
MKNSYINSIAVLIIALTLVSTNLKAQNDRSLYYMRQILKHHMPIQLLRLNLNSILVSQVHLLFLQHTIIMDLNITM